MMSSLNERFMLPNLDIPIFMINRKQDVSRKEKTILELKKVGFKNIHVFEAVEQETAIREMHFFFSASVYKNIVRGPFNTNIIPTWSAAACAISHYRVWEQICNDELILEKDHVIICEDDIYIQNGDLLLFYLLEFLRCDPEEQQIFFFQSFLKKLKSDFYPSYSHSFEFFQDQHSFSLFRELKDFFLFDYAIIPSHFYGASKKTIQYMIQHALPIHYQMDIHISYTLRKSCNLAIFFCEDCGVFQEKNKISSTQYYNLRDEDELFDVMNHVVPLEICKFIFPFLPMFHPVPKN